MFTGIIKETGIIKSKKAISVGLEFEIACPLLNPLLQIDDSLAVNGTCQTVVKKTSESVTVQTIKTTLIKTNLGQLNVGDSVNLEPSLRFGSGVEGHIVQGHVNGVTKIAHIEKSSDQILLWLEIDSNWQHQIVREGSIAIDGISLTISHLEDDRMLFACSIIPHTWENTVMKKYKLGTLVNIEVDILAQYVARMMKFSNKKEISLDWLQQQGF